MGNLDAFRDWGYARDYVQAMWLMLQQDQPADCVIATGKQDSVREFADAAFSYFGLNDRDYVRVDPRLLQPVDVNTLLDNASKSRSRLAWFPTCAFTELAHEMVGTDVCSLKESTHSV